MSFCVECGADGPTVEGLCAEDFARKHDLVRVPETIDVVRCAHCGKLQLPRGWAEHTLEDAVPDLIAAAARTDRLVERVEYGYDLHPLEETTERLTVKASCRVGPWHLNRTFKTTIRVHRGACPTCSRQKGNYYVGTVQVRADGRSLTPEESRKVHAFASRGRQGSEEFVSRMEAVRGGLDVRVSTNPYAKRLARDIAKSFGGTVGSSATLHTQREGRDAYRSTYVVRLPGFREGDVLDWRGMRYRVVELGDPVKLEDLKTGARTRVRTRELRRARTVRE